MREMFSYCQSLTSLDVSSFNTENVTDMRGMFSYCQSLTSLDVSNFNTENVTNMSEMFYGCSQLKRIFCIEGWDNSLRNGEAMFWGCKSLVGGAGTIYDQNHIDITYARLDGGTANPGYFTYLIFLSFDGRAFSINNGQSASTINHYDSFYYTLDGSEPTTESLYYSGEAVPLSNLCTVKVTAISNNGEQSEVSTLVVNSLFDGVTARFRDGGTIDEAFQWCGGLSGADGLAAVIWDCKDDFPDSVAVCIDNPNLLLYVNKYSQATRSGVRNIVEGDLAKRITLTDNTKEDGTRGTSSFFVPQAFRVQNDISYTHTYSQKTPIGSCGGWETIALPFDVQAITHAVNGEVVPFASYTFGKRPFWLCRLTEDGFVDADCIEANTPYIISMPNNTYYTREYCLNGEVTFSARDVIVPATELHPSSRAGASFIPTFERVPASPSVYVLNVGEERWGYAEGSLFDRDYRDVHPFEAYRTTAAAGVPYMAIGDELRGATTVDNLKFIIDNDAALYDLSGRRFIGHPKEKGVYISNGKKVLVK